MVKTKTPAKGPGRMEGGLGVRASSHPDAAGAVPQGTLLLRCATSVQSLTVVFNLKPYRPVTFRQFAQPLQEYVIEKGSHL